MLIAQIRALRLDAVTVDHRIGPAGVHSHQVIQMGLASFHHFIVQSARTHPQPVLSLGQRHPMLGECGRDVFGVGQHLVGQLRGGGIEYAEDAHRKVLFGCE